MKIATIVVIDDDQTNLQLLDFLLRNLGYTVFLASTGESGLLIIASENPALVLVDIELPGINGYDVLKAIRCNERCSSVPVIAVTALAMPEDRTRGLAAGFDDYLTKPIDIHVLSALIEKTIFSCAKNNAKIPHSPA